MTMGAMAGKRVLVVEDEYFLADDVKIALLEAGADVLGPVATTEGAEAVIVSSARIDAALLDINLRGEMAFAVADTLSARSIPFAFVTGYDQSILPDRFSSHITVQKPVSVARLIELLTGDLLNG